MRDLCLNGVVPRKTPSHQNFPTASSNEETRGGKFWDQFDGVRFTQSTPRQASIRREIKDHRSEKNPVKIPHQRSPYNVKIEDRSQGETLGKSDAAAMHGILPKIFTSSKKIDCVCSVCVCCVCASAVCVCVCCVCWSKICVLPGPPRPPQDSPSAGPPLRRTAQNFGLFFPFSRHNFLSFFSLLGVLSLNFGGV